MELDCEKLKIIDDYDDDPEYSIEELRNMEKIVALSGCEHVYFAIDGKVFRYFEGTGKGYLHRLNVLVNSLLKDYVNKHTEGGFAE